MVNQPDEPVSLYRSPQGYATVMAMYAEGVQRGPVPYTTHYVATPYGRTHIVSGGPATAPPVLLFHGWNGSACGIGSEFPFLFTDYRVHMPDIIGHAGKSAASRPPTRGDAYPRWAEAILDALGIKETFVIGISGGGWLALKVAAHLPQRTHRVVALSTDGLSTPQWWSLLTGMVPAAVWPTRTTLNWFINTMLAPTTPRGPATTDFAVGMGMVLKHYKSQGNPGQLRDDELRRITSPALVLMGEHEQVFQARPTIDRARALIPGLVAAELVPRAGHLMTLDQPDWLSARVLKFLQAGV